MGAIAELLNELARVGITMEVRGDKLRYRPRDAMTPDLARRLKAHKPAVLAYLRGVEPEAGSNIGADNTSEPEPSEPTPNSKNGNTHTPAWGDCIDPGPECPRCGSLEKWWPIVGEPRCQGCDPPTVAIRALAHAARIRKRHGKADPPGAADCMVDKGATGR